MGLDKVVNPQGLRTFDGVFTPTVLTILGVVMYLRLGWVVGNAGFVDTLAIIFMAHAITICTALSMASMVSNIEIGAGGAYAIISRSLGFEIGGAIGIPLYFSQAFSVAFYIIGFVELWLSFFPTHSPTLVALVTWAVLAGVSIKSAQLAFRVQYFVLAAIVASLVSFFTGPSLLVVEPVWRGAYAQSGFWETFAIFFPAVTGILAGVSMSGELRTPRRSIILGTLAAIAVGLAVYVAMAYWFAHQAPESALLTNMSIILELSAWKPAVVAGILGATLSSALSTLVGAPRTLAALAVNRLVPFPRFLGKRAADNEPRNAVMVSSLLSLAVLMAGNLDQLAQLLTMFFLTTYGVINLVVLIEQGSGIISFRPRLQVSILIPLAGFIGCILTMLLIDKLFTLTTVVVVLFIYSILARRENKIDAPWGDVRGGFFTAITEWAAQKTLSLQYHPRVWKPAVLAPAETPEDLRRISRFVGNLLSPSGRLYFLSFHQSQLRDAQLAAQYEELLKPLRDKKLFMRKMVVHSRDNAFEANLYTSLQILLNSFLPPNSILFTISGEPEKRQRMARIYQMIRPLNIGLLYLHIHPKLAFGQEKSVHLWLRHQSPNMNLAVLTALQLTRNWDAALTIFRVIDDPAEVSATTGELELFVEQARLPVSTRVRVLTGDYCEHLGRIHGDVTILGMPAQFDQMIDLAMHSPGTVLFVADSGLEDATV